MLMRAVVLEGFGDASVLKVRSKVEAPEPQGEEVRVRVHAFGVNRADTLQRRGLLYTSVAGAIPGREYAGEVESLGPQVRDRKVGDRVFGIVSSGTYAELVCVHERLTMQIPANLTFEEAAAIPETFMTAFDALQQGGFEPGSSALIHAVGSGVGIAAVQLVSAAGGVSIGTSRTAEKLERAREFGLTAAALLNGDWDELARAHTGGQGVDVILEFIGPSIFERNMAALRIEGSIVQVAQLAGSTGEINVELLKLKRATWIAPQLRPRPLEKKIDVTRRFERLIVPQFARGGLRAVVDHVQTFDQISDAHRYMDENRNFGCIVVRII
jgi:NADPH:quinone reductase-like Zn-dependent oxidoreductase